MEVQIGLEELYKEGWIKIGYYADCYIMKNDNQRILYSYIENKILFEYEFEYR